jgi:hypothetical protein
MTRAPKKPASKALDRATKKLKRLQSRGARPRRLRRLASRAQGLLVNYQARIGRWIVRRDLFLAEQAA